MRILVTGREGQVARALAERAGQAANLRHKLVFATRPDFDLAEPASIEAMVARTRPDLVISAAAYTAVDRAEDEPELAMAVNGKAPGILGRAAAGCGARVIHLSTDYVFDGSGTEPWCEDDPTAPLGVYGRTKLAGEQALASSGADYAILRTAWVYSPFGNNFVKTMLRLAESRDVLNVVEDQFGNPTSAFDIADALLVVADRWGQEPAHGVNRAFHLAGTGSTDWAEFARAIFAGSAARGGPSCTVTGIPSSEYPTKAVRPANSRLDCGRFARSFGYHAPDWRASLGIVLDRLLA